MTDPKLLDAGGHVRWDPRVTSTRKTNLAIDLNELPNINIVLLPHCHADHFDQEVEQALRRDLPIVTTPHATQHPTSRGGSESFTSFHALDVWEALFIGFENKQPTGEGVKSPSITVTGMPGEHVTDRILGTANDLLNDVPPTNGWVIERGEEYKFETKGGKPRCLILHYQPWMVKWIAVIRRQQTVVSYSVSQSLPHVVSSTLLRDARYPPVIKHDSVVTIYQ